MFKRMRVRLIEVVACLALATVWAVLAIPGAALADKPDTPPGKDKDGGDGGNTDLRLARIHFADSPRIQWDGGPTCDDGTSDPEWHYWDQRDTALWQECPVVLSDGIQTGVSGGGRLFFFTATDIYKVSPSDRYLVLDLTPIQTGDESVDDPDPFIDENAEGPNIDYDVYAGTDYADLVNENTFIDNVKTYIKMDMIFKNRPARQPLELQVRKPTPTGAWGPTLWSLRSVNDLYVEIPNSQDKDFRILTTFAPAGENDADLFELRYNDVPIGTYRIPLTWIMRIVPSP